MPGGMDVTGGNAWCQPGATSGSGRSQVKVMVEASMLTEDRNVNLTVKAGTLKAVLAVTQKGVDALTLSKDKFEVEQEGGDITVEVKSNIGYTVTIPTAFSGWLKQSPQSKAMATKNYRFTVLPNEESEYLFGDIFFRCSCQGTFDNCIFELRVLKMGLAYRLFFLSRLLGMSYS